MDGGRVPHYIVCSRAAVGRIRSVCSLTIATVTRVSTNKCVSDIRAWVIVYYLMDVYTSIYQSEG